MNFKSYEKSKANHNFPKLTARGVEWRIENDESGKVITESPIQDCNLKLSNASESHAG